MIKRIFHQLINRQAAFLLGCLFAYGCENSQRSLDEWTKKRVMVEEAHNIQTLFSSSGRMRADLRSPLMLRYTSDTLFVEFPQKLHVDFFDSLGTVESRLDARYGKYFESMNRVFLKDSVVVSNRNGDTLRCPELWWDQNSQLFYTDKLVRIRRKDQRIYGGKGMQATQDLNSVTIFQIEQPSMVAIPDSLAAR